MNLSNRQYAKHRGVTEGAVRKALKNGRITKEADGLINPAKADIQWANNSDPAKKRKMPSKTQMAALGATEKEFKLSEAEDLYQRAKTAHEVLKAEIGKIELRILKGELVNRKDFLAKVFKLARSERDAWLNWPARVSAELAAELDVDEHELHTALYESVHEILSKMAQGKL